MQEQPRGGLSQRHRQWRGHPHHPPRALSQRQWQRVQQRGRQVGPLGRRRAGFQVQ